MAFDGHQAYTSADNKKCAGDNRVVGLYGKTLDECSAACKANPDCKYFNMNPVNHAGACFGCDVVPTYAWDGAVGYQMVDATTGPLAPS